MQREVSKMNSSSTFFLRGLPSTIISTSIASTSMQSSGQAIAQRLQAMQSVSCVSGSMLSRGAPWKRGATSGRTLGYCSGEIPLPPTESVSVSAPKLYLSVSCKPFNRSTMKKRCSFSMNFGLGTLTSAISVFPIADFQLPIDARLPINCSSRITVPGEQTGNRHLPIGSALALARCRSYSRHRRLTLRQVHQLDVPALTLQIEVARAPVDPRQQQAGKSES